MCFSDAFYRLITHKKKVSQILFILFLQSFYLNAESQPLIVLLDAHQEVVAKKTGAITNYLAYALIEKSTPILVNGAVFHNFLLLQKKAIDQLDRLPYPTVQKLCLAVQKSKEETIEFTKETIAYLATLREEFDKNLPAGSQQVNQSRLESAGQAFLMLIPESPITKAINEADFQIIPTINQFLEHFQNEYNATLKTLKGTSATIKYLQKNYQTLLDLHLKEAQNVRNKLQKNLTLLIEARATLNQYLFEYVYRFADTLSRDWTLYFQQANDLYLLVPKKGFHKGINTKGFAPLNFDFAQSPLKMIAQHAIKTQGLYSLYQRELVNPLENIDQFFLLKNNAYLFPLDLFVVGHGDKQSSVIEYNNRMKLIEKKIKNTISILQLLKNNSEILLSEIWKKPVSGVISDLINLEKVSQLSYRVMADELNKKCIDQLYQKNKNPFKPDPIDIENFLITEYNHLNQNEVEISSFWKLISELEFLYQKAYESIVLTIQSERQEERVAESAHLAGMTTSQLTSFVGSSVEKRRINMIYLFTCFGGGANRLIFEKMAQLLNANEKQKVDFAVGALTDASVPSLIPTLDMFIVNEQATVSFEPPFSFKEFFKKGLSVEGLEAITVGQKYSKTSNIKEYFHGVADLPWKYNHETERLELVSLKGLLYNLTPEFLKKNEKSEKSISIENEKVIMVNQPENDISLILQPADDLLPLICSSQTEQKAIFEIKEIKLPANTLQDLLAESIGHLRQSKSYKIKIDSLVCRGITKKMKNFIPLKEVTISSRAIPDPLYENEKDRPEQTGVIEWEVAIGAAPGYGSVSSKYRCRDFFNKQDERLFELLSGV